MRAIAAALLLLIAGTATAQPGAADFHLSGQAIQGGALTGTAPSGTVMLLLDDKPVSVDADGRFLIAFDRDAPPTARLSARMPDGRTLDQSLTVAPRDWRIERINAPMRPTKSTEAFLALRKPELEAIAAARTTVTDAQGWRQRFVWPRMGRISGLFGAQRIYQGTPGAYHGGVDVAAATGEPVVAPADGVVILAASDKPFTLEGHLLMIDHGHGLNSAFLHLSRIDVKVGDHVAQGQRIGAVGATGRATGPHLHWGMKWNDARIDPLLIAGPMPAER
ncbi:Murein DD-endopeptidase MepM and murein hydrolase activator NlpD, contain LysM domain [Sphingobium sp. AP50]|uniref:M23 family metallopeptidase n=1 Tax=Sphingobium sp. AP50 TaxID=1884369 RepID=UPI0008B228CD|nr:M23 family metallopeptidase [Sphingobium sp. AP50]SEJ99409.1 Murein DD-endopeptidase MepM and murein hydrolase activator NlpD, contain LysM domain [Sphingobium sp. AP50]